MPIKFAPVFQITPKIAADLMRIEAAKERIAHLPVTIAVLSGLRETARLFTTHYSTMIEGNRLYPDEIEEVLKHEGHFPGRERDEREVKGYYAALKRVEQWAAQKAPLTENMVQILHALVMGDGREKVKPSPYREAQNVIRDARSKVIIYMPPEAKDVPGLMTGLIHWLREQKELPCPILAAIAHYQYATIHPYYDGNGRTARLLTTLLLHLGGYDLKGLYSLEEYYARNLDAYYQAISIGPSHNYYLGRAEADITSWVEYFIGGMAFAFEKVLQRMSSPTEGEKDQEQLLRKLDPKQRKVLELFRGAEIVTSAQIGEVFGFKPRSATQLCRRWAETGFLEMVDSSKKGRRYKLHRKFVSLMK